MSNQDKLSRRQKRRIAHHQKSSSKSENRRNLRKAKKQLKRNQSSKSPRQKQWLPRNLDVSGLDYEDLDAWDDLLEIDDPEYAASERIMPLDEGDRRRRLEQLAFRAADGAETPAETDGTDEDDNTLAGRVLAVSNGICTVQLGARTIPCHIRSALTVEETGFTNPVAVGDRVQVLEDGVGGGVIEQVQPRRTILARPDVFRSHLRQILVANADQLLIVASWRDPVIWLELIDRYLVAAQRSDLPAVLCINKMDLAEDVEAVARTLAPYRALAVPVVLTSAESGRGIEELRERLLGRTTVLTGLSGVGKSSLLSAVQPGLDLRTGGVSDHSGEGRHTTTLSAWFPLRAGGAVVDTPGIREFGLNGLYKRDLAAYFPDIAEVAADCRFTDCTHIDDPGCAVRPAVQAGRLAESRYHSYQRIRETLPS